MLLLLATTTGNVPTHRFLTNLLFERILVATEYYEPGMALPPHHLVFNAVGEADTSEQALAGAAGGAGQHEAAGDQSSGRGAGNQPAGDRGAAGGGSGGGDGEDGGDERGSSCLRADAARCWRRRGLCFRCCCARRGFMAGSTLCGWRRIEELAGAVGELPGDELLVIEYLDARGADGKSRKYRVMLIDGRLYPLHVAISSDWMIHYFSAEMAESAENRAEDEAFLRDMPGVLGERAVAALEQVQRILGLDYGGIDFGLNARGEVLIFEANSTMTVVVPDRDPRWDYRRPVVQGIYQALLQMLIKRAGEGNRA